MKLNLGCFVQMFPGWLHMDYLDLAAPAQQRGVEFVQADLRKGIPLPDQCIDVVYSSHMFEHLNPWHELMPLLQDCWRVLRPGGLLRAVLPDLAKLVQGYVTRDWSWLDPKAQADRFHQLRSPALKFSMIAFGGDGPDYRRENWGGHMCMYDVEGLAELCERSGFAPAAITPGVCNRSSHPHVQAEYASGAVYDMWPDHSFALEAVK